MSPSISGASHEQVDTVIESSNVRVIQIELDVSAGELARLHAVLSADERARAERFSFALHRDRFVARRGSLRRILAKYTNRDPADLTFRTNRNGKPELLEGNRYPALRFNISSSGGIAFCAVTRRGAVGIDIERIRADIDADEIEHLASRFFSANEQALLAALAGSERFDAFFACWTLKEAFVKARGDGLSLPLDQFDVDPAAFPSALVRTAWAPEEARSWMVRPIVAPAGHAAALATIHLSESSRNAAAAITS